LKQLHCVPKNIKERNISMKRI